MGQIDQLLSALGSEALPPAAPEDRRPSRRLAVLACMDTRLDVVTALGLRIGDAHILRNAGGRVTADVLRSLALSSHVLGTDTVLLMQHTGCGLTGVTDEYLRELTGADIEFLAIDDHVDSLRHDLAAIANTPYLVLLEEIAGILYDIESGEIVHVERWDPSRRT